MLLLLLMMMITTMRLAIYSVLSLLCRYTAATTTIDQPYYYCYTITSTATGIEDLHQSFQSGRLYNQVEAMSRYYRYPCLLIEFHPDKAFTLLVSESCYYYCYASIYLPIYLLLTYLSTYLSTCDNRQRMRSHPISSSTPSYPRWCYWLWHSLT